MNRAIMHEHNDAYATPRDEYKVDDDGKIIRITSDRTAAISETVSIVNKNIRG